MNWPCHFPDCTQPTEPTGRVFGMDAVGFDGEDTKVWFQGWRCLVGHYYQVEVWDWTPTDEEDDD